MLAQPPYDPILVDELAREALVIVASQSDQQSLIREGRSAVALVARGVDLDHEIGAEILDALPRLAICAAFGSGADYFDVRAASERGIPILHNPGVAPGPVVEYTIATIGVLGRQLLTLDEMLRSGYEWSRREDFVGHELARRRLALIGIGAIGREVGRRAMLAYDMDVIAFDPHVDERVFVDHQFSRADTLSELLTQADVLSIHTPLNQETRGLVGATELALLPHGAIVINSSRGPIVDEKALTDSLERGHLSGVAIDVFSREPPQVDGPLFRAPNALLTPHAAGSTTEGMKRLSMTCANDLLTALNGERPPNLINPEAWPPSRL